MTIPEIELPADADRHTVASPGYATRPGEIVGVERVPPELIEIVRQAWSRPVVEPREIEVLRLRDVFVAGEGLVFDRERRLVRRSVTQQSAEDIRLAHRELERAIAAGALRERHGAAILCVKPGLRNYGHWLIEMLPMAGLADFVLAGERLPALVPDVEGPLAGVIADSLGLLGFPPERIVPALSAPERVDELVLVIGLTSHGGAMSPLVFQTLDRLADGIAPLPYYERLYVRRQWPPWRRLADDEAVTARLMAEGYVPYSPEQFPLAHQMGAFRTARQVIGPAGAALANIAFCRPGTEVAAFYPANMPDNFFSFIAQHRGLDFIDVRCEAAGPPRSHMPYDTDLKLDPAVLERLVASGARLAPRRKPSRWRKAVRFFKVR
ncbi:MAG: glycosyltransferase family 61 protein [Methylobacteriaceae bacterium]|nr:glycosyltransferase family 61 protein [Methylobacteriaceae bacterium]